MCAIVVNNTARGGGGVGERHDRRARGCNEANVHAYPTRYSMPTYTTGRPLPPDGVGQRDWWWSNYMVPTQDIDLRQL